MTNEDTPAVLAAAQDPSHPQFHFSLGALVSTVLRGLIDASKAYQNPATIEADLADFVQGFLTDFLSTTNSTATPSTQ
jgi:hypothetical protein